MFRYIFTISLFCILSLLVFWPQPSKAECKIYEESSSLAYTNVGGLSLKYSEPKALYLVVGTDREKYLPEVLKRGSVIYIATKYLRERMLPCTGLSKIEVVNDAHDKRLVEDDVLVAYIKVDYHHAVVEPASAATVFRQPTAMVRSGYVRTDVYQRSQFYDERVSFIPLDGQESELKELVRRRIIDTLHPTLRYNANVEPKHNPDFKVLKKKE